MSMFDAEEMMNLTTEGAMETSMTPVPEGEWPAYIKKVDFRQGEKNDRQWVACDLTWAVTDQSVIDQLGIPEPTVRQSLFLDIANGLLELGPNKNVQLGRLRAAVGQNGPGEWGFGMLEGQAAVVRVEHREYEGQIFADVKGVTAF